MPTRDFVTRREYDAWISECASLALALGFPVRPEMVHDNVGLVLGDDQYQAFENGMWSREPYEVFAIFEALNEPAVAGLPVGARDAAVYSGLCHKLMIVHPGKFCAPHFHWRKTESYEVLMGEMDLFYRAEFVEFPDRGLRREGLVDPDAMPAGGEWPPGVDLPAGRDDTYELLHDHRRLRPGDAVFVMHRTHLHAFRCPPESRTPLVIRELSTYSHEPTASTRDGLWEEWADIHDNCFLCEAANRGRLVNNIVDD